MALSQDDITPMFNQNSKFGALNNIDQLPEAASFEVNFNRNKSLSYRDGSLVPSAPARNPPAHSISARPSADQYNEILVLRGAVKQLADQNCNLRSELTCA